MPVSLEALLPPYFKGVYEFEALMGVAGEELDRAENAMKRVKDNLYVQTCDAATLARYERLLGVAAAQGASMAGRRGAVLNRMNRRLPYTTPKLREDLDAEFGREGYELYVRHEMHELELDLIDQDYPALLGMRTMIRETIPAHLLFILAGKYPVAIPVETACAARSGLSSGFYARYNRTFLHLDGAWNLDGTYKLNGYKERIDIDLYPSALTIGGAYDAMPDACARAVCRAGIRAPAKTASGTGTRFGCRQTSLTENGIRMGADAAAAPGLGCRLRVENDLWYLDGSRALDGSKPLDAETFEYEV